MKGKRTLLAALCGAAVCLLLVFAMLAAERGAPGQGGIRTWPDAVWYAIATLTTVGYGDLVPVSVPGKLIGALLMVLSIGLWATLIGAAWSLVRDVLLPYRRIARISRKPWYVFSERNEAAEALAADLTAAEPESRAVFCADGAGTSDIQRSLSVPQDVRTLLSHRLARKAPRTVFLTGRDEWANAALAERLQPLCGEIYSYGEEAAAMDGTRSFDADTLCARQYWLKHPAGREESVFLLCGGGKRAQALLERGLLACCRQPFRPTVFHVFGDWSDYRRMHPELGAVLAMNTAAEGRDSLFFHEEPWNADRSLTESADRILFAADDERENAALAAALMQAFPVRGEIHAATSLPVRCAVRFGMPSELYTGETVMRQSLDRLACALHSAYIGRTGAGPAWEELSPFLRDSNRSAADHLLTKLRLLLPDEDVRAADAETCRRAAAVYASLSEAQRENCRRNEHMRWWVFHALHNWRSAPMRDDARRLHPDMVPYELLSAEDRVKDDSAWTIIDTIAREGRA